MKYGDQKGRGIWYYIKWKIRDFFWYRYFSKWYVLKTFDYFVEQSENYPYWWRNYEWWGNTSSSPRYNEKNPLYLSKYKGK